MSKRGWKPRRGRAWRVVRRSSLLWWTLTLTMGLVTATVVGSAIGRATSAADRWGESRAVWLVRHALDGRRGVHAR